MGPLAMAALAMAALAMTSMNQEKQFLNYVIDSLVLLMLPVD